MEPRRGPLTAGEKVQFTDRKGKKITDQLVAGGSTQTEHGLILHDDVIGKTEGTVIPVSYTHLTLPTTPYV